MGNNDFEEKKELTEVESENEQTTEKAEAENETVYSDGQQAVTDIDAEVQAEQSVDGEAEKKPKKPMGRVAVAFITAVITAVVSVFCTLVAVGKFPKIYNKYGAGTSVIGKTVAKTKGKTVVDVTGRTIKDIAKEKGISTLKLLKEFGLPTDMPEETTETEAYYAMTIGDVARINKLDYEWVKAQLSLDEKVTDEAIWGEIEDGLTLKQYIGEDEFEDFKKEYGLGDKVTLDTKFKDVRGDVYKAMKKAQNGKPESDINIVVKYSTFYNKYNHMGYLDISGRTISETAEGLGMELSEFLEEYGLPADMPGNTSENAADNLIPVRILAERYGGFEALKEMLGFDDSVTEDTPMGEALEGVKLEKYVGEAGFESFKEEYELGEDVTLDTTWGEVREQVEQKQKEMYDAQRAESGK